MIKTKAAVTVEELGEQYCLIGPYNESCVRTEVELVEPDREPLIKTMEQMRAHGIKVHVYQCLYRTFKIVFNDSIVD